MAKNKDNELNVREYSSIRNVFYCIRHAMKAYPLLLLWCILIIVASVALPVLTTFLPKVVIEKITSGSDLRELLTSVLVFTLSIALVTGVKHFFEHLLSFDSFKMNTYHLRRIANKGMHTDYDNQQNEYFRKLQDEAFVTSNSNFSANKKIFDVIIALVSNSLGFVLYFSILSELNIFIVLFLIVTTLISYLLSRKTVNWLKDNKKEQLNYQSRTNYINRVSDEIQFAKDIRLYSMTSWFHNIYTKNLDGLLGWYKRYTSKVFGVSIFDSGFSLLREGAAYAYLIWMVLDSQISVSDFVLYFGVITGFSVWLSGILSQVTELNGINLRINYLRAYLEYPEKFNRSGIGISDKIKLPKIIELRNVSYRYEGASDFTLKNINLTIDPKEHLAVVGLNGAGKTTLVRLICVLVDPTEGSVLYDGVDVREYDRREYYKLFSAVFQQFSILPVKFAEIVAEDVYENADLHKVEECLKYAGLLNKIVSLPNGLQSEYSKRIYDEGIELSGGETQKLLFARALYRNTPLVILDEPTAALDPIAESKLYETYDRTMNERSVIFISHRLASTRFCDRILLLENGGILESGTHDELIYRKGRYYELFETQAKYYREEVSE